MKLLLTLIIACLLLTGCGLREQADEKQELINLIDELK